jgi:hypothetical protein
MAPALISKDGVAAVREALRYLPKDAAHGRIAVAFGSPCDDGGMVELASPDALVLSRDLVGLRQTGQVIGHDAAIIRLVAQLATMQ